MLNIYPTAADAQSAPCAQGIWIDLFDPTPEETARVSAECHVQVPSREALQEIETSSRTRADGEVLYMSMPLAIQDSARGLTPVPLGFILTPRRLITVRYSDVHAFANVIDHVRGNSNITSAGVFAALIDGMVDYDADVLEKLSADLAAVSARAFGQRGRGTPQRQTPYPCAAGMRHCHRNRAVNDRPESAKACWGCSGSWVSCTR